MPEIFVINLEERTDKMQHITNTFKNYFKINRIDAIKRDDGWYGCLLSHMKCIKHAKDNNLKYIIVMEDDCNNMYTNWFGRIMMIKEKIFDKKDDWDIFLGGSLTTNTSGIKKYDCELENIYRINDSLNTHFIVYNHTCYDYFLERENGSCGPIDVLWHNNQRCIMSVPFIFTVKAFRSDISREYEDFVEKVKENESKLKREIRKSSRSSLCCSRWVEA